MTLFVSTRQGGDGSSLAPPAGYEGPFGTAAKPTVTALTPEAFARRLENKHVLVATHGFNVGFENGVRSLDRLGAYLNLGPGWAFVGVLWPGDFFIPVVNYSWEADDAVKSGRRLARYLNAVGAGANSFSFLSHSLGARVVLEAAGAMGRKVRSICVTAAAADDNTLTTGHNLARTNCGPISVLSSLQDKTLFLAYPVGDFFSDATYDRDSPWKGALGRYGSNPREPEVINHPIPRAADYDHGDYFPPGGPKPVPTGKWTAVADHARRHILAQVQTWP